MRNPFKKGEVFDSPSGCEKVAVGGTLVALGVISGLVYLTYLGVTGFLAQI